MKKDYVINWSLLGIAGFLAVVCVVASLKAHYAMCVAVGALALLTLAVLQIKDKFARQQKELDKLRESLGGKG